MEYPVRSCSVGLRGVVAVWRRRRRPSVAAFALLGGLVVAGCLPPTEDDGRGGGAGSRNTGGKGGAGGTVFPGSGGAGAGSGGAPAGTGGSAVGTGGDGSGGAPGDGGATGSGGATGGAGGRGGGAGGSTSGSGGAGSGSGGRVGSGGSGTGGLGGTGGAPGTNVCTNIGPNVTVNATIRARAGETYDGMCKRFIAGPSLGDGSQGEGQKPVFDVEDGATLINVVIGSPAADGIHTLGNATLRNITWEDIGEDALTVSKSGTVTLDGGSAQNGSDKIFQINAASTFRVSNFKATNGGKFVRQNGGTTFKMSVFIDRCDIADMKESIARTDSSTSTVSLTNSRYSKISKQLFIGFASGNITQSNNTPY